jgi:tetratricopeptide (TPR) repeat protein
MIRFLISIFVAIHMFMGATTRALAVPVDDTPATRAAVLFDEASRLQAEGKWREAVPILEQLVALQPLNARALYQLGSMKSWKPGERTQALELLRMSCEISSNNPEYCGAYAEVLSWSPADRGQAVARLRGVVSAHPESVQSRLRLAQILSWSGRDRAQALELYDQGLRLEPGNVELLIASAEVLSWSSNTRAEAGARYDKALHENPQEPRALTGKAQLLAWSGRTAEAMELYGRVLSKDPNNAAALRGQAEILNWKGEYKQARSLARQARSSAPNDDLSKLELARADVGLREFTEAHEALADVKGNPGPGFLETRQEIHRGLGTWLELGYADRRERNLPFDRFAASFSTPVAPGQRLTFSYLPGLFNPTAQGFNTNYFQASLDSTKGDAFAGHFQIGAETFNNAPNNIDGGVDLRFKPRTSLMLQAAFLRQPVEETRLSRRGEEVSGTFLAQVRSNLASFGAGYYNSAHKFDLSLSYTDGAYTGHNVDANRRYSIEAQVGRAFHSDRPYVRVAYGINYTGFGHDADIYAGVPLSRATGGYFSPTHFLLNQGIVNVSHRFSNSVRWEATGTAGVQNPETSRASFTNTQFASSFATRLFWRTTPDNEVTLGYEYLNVFNAFDRNLFLITWRHYF